MSSEGNGSERGLTPLRVIPGEVVSHSYPDDVVERCYALWATKAGMNASATVRYYQGEVEDGVPVPTPQAVRKWAREQGWRQRRIDDYTQNHGERLYDLQSKYLAVMDGHADVMLEAQAGAYDDNPAAGIVRLKPGELVTKVIERGILPLMPAVTAAEVDTDDMSRDEREAIAKQAIARGSVRSKAG